MTYDSKALQRSAGITGRQMDHWYRKGWLISFDRNPEQGSGVPIEWPIRTVRKAILMSALIKAGFVPERAHQIAEKNLNRPNMTQGSYPWSVRVGAHIVITIMGEGI